MERVLPTTLAACSAPPPQWVAQAAGTHGGAPPVLGAATSPRPSPVIRLWHFVLLLFLFLPVLCAIGIASYFHLSSSTQALRGAVMESVPGQWHKRFAINVGYMTLSLARFGSSFFNLPPEAKAGLQSLDHGEVGVYQLDGPMPPPDYSLILRTADKSMRRRGWERIVGVTQGSQFVAVYAPSIVRLKNMSCCVAVLNDHDLVVVSARGDISPLFDIAQRHLHDHGPFIGNF